MKRPQILIGSALLVLVLVLGGWYAFTNPQVASAFGFHRMPANGMASTTPNGHGMMARGGFATGSIETLNGNGFTLTLTDGTTKTVTLTATTSIQFFATASSSPATTTIDQLSTGEKVTVMGAPQADGSILATRVLAGTLPQGGFGRGMMRGGMASSTWHGGANGSHGMGGPSMGGAQPGGPEQPAQ